MSDTTKDPVSELLQKTGAKSVEDLLDEYEGLKRADRNRRSFEWRKDDEVRQLRAEIETLKAQKVESDFGLGPNADASMKKLAVRIAQAEEKLTGVLRKVMLGDEEAELDPYIGMAKEKYPALMKIPDTVERSDAILDAARSLRDAEGLGERVTKERKSATDKAIAGSRATLTGGGMPVSTRSSSEEQEYEEYQKQLRNAKSQDERERIADAWAAKHSESRL